MMDWSLINAALRRAGIPTDAAENHGILCGLLCARGADVQQEWVALMRDEYVPAAEDSDHEAWSNMLRLYSETVRQLRDEGFVFCLLLPDESQPLNRRAEAMTEWCQGFLYGLAAGGLEDHSMLPDEAREIIQDIVEISRAAAVSDEEESDEAAYAELVEYLRVGVLLVFETLEAERGSQADDRVIH